jgi:hypothetical protein
MIENLDFWIVILTLIGGFGAVIGLLLSFKSDLIRVSDRSEQKDSEIEEKLISLSKDFYECRAAHCNEWMKGAKE